MFISDSQKFQARVIAFVALCALLSLAFSSLALLISFQNKKINGYSQSENGRGSTLSLKRHTRDVNHIAEHEACQGEATSYTIHRSLRNVSKKLHELTCGYRDAKLQLDGWAEEFNAIVYFINEIGMNMNAAKSQIQENRRNLDLLAERTGLKNSTSSEPDGARIDRIERKLNHSVQDGELRLQRTQVMVGSVQNQLQELQTTVANLVNANGSTVGRNIRTPPALQGVADEFRDKMKKNSLMIDINRNTLAEFRNQISGMASEGWFNAPNGYQYFLSKNAFRTNSYLRSRRYCMNRNSDLAYVGMRDPDVFRFLWVNLIGPSRHQCVWFGLSDIEREGQWKWMDGKDSRTYWTHWAIGQPGTSSNEDCAMIRAGMWMDGHCNGLRKLCSFLCERIII